MHARSLKNSHGRLKNFSCPATLWTSHLLINSLKPAILVNVPQKRATKDERLKKYYNMKTHPLPQIMVGSAFRMALPNEKQLSFGTCTHEEAALSGQSRPDDTQPKPPPIVTRHRSHRRAEAPGQYAHQLTLVTTSCTS